MSPSSEPAVINAEATVTLSANLHARPAGRLAQAAARFESTIEIEHAGRTVNPTGILSVMALGATLGSTITIRASGPDAEHAVQELAKVLAEAE
jgi:phosphotransferase system HPr (HPr) family protein